VGTATHESALAQAYLGEMVDRFNPASESQRPVLVAPLLFNGEGWLRLPAIVALFACARTAPLRTGGVPFLLVGFVI